MSTFRPARPLVPGLVLLLALTVCTPGAAGADDWDRTLRLEVQLPQRLTAGVEQQLHVVVSGTNGRAVSVSARLRRANAARGSGQALFEVPVRADGAFQPTFTIPAELTGELRLVARAESPDGIQELFLDIEVEPAPLVTYISTDKPLYQPGQTVHIRTVSFDPLTLTAADNRDVTVEVRNSLDVMVWRQTVQTGPFGVSAAPFVLARDVPVGTYRVVAQVGGTRTDLPFEVREYQLPKFIISIDTDRAWYRPDDSVEMTIGARYTFGEPVAGAQARLEVTVFDPATGGQRGSMGTLTGETNADGEWRTNWSIPADAADWFGDSTTVPLSLRVVVTDTGGLTELTSKALVLAKRALQVEFVPENNVVVPGVENRIFVIVSYPDGSPAPSTLEIEGVGEIDTDATGTGVFAFTPDARKAGRDFLNDGIDIKGVDEFNNRPEFEWKYTKQPGAHLAEAGHVLLRPDKVVLGESESPQLTVARSPWQPEDAGTLKRYLIEVRKLGHTVSIRSVSLSQAGGAFDVALPASLFGQIELVLHEVVERRNEDADAVAGRETEQAVRANVARTTVYRPKDDAIDLEIVPGLEEYRPGDQGEIIIRATRRSGAQGPVILGLDIIDTAIFGLTDIERESVRVAFLLQRMVLGDRLHHYMTAIDGDGVNEAARDRIAATVLSRTTAPLADLAGEDSLTFANRRTQTVLDKLTTLLRRYKPFLHFDGQWRNPFEWLLDHSDETGFAEDDLFDAWGNRVEFLEKYLDDEWVLVSPGPDGQRNPEKDDDPVNADNVVSQP